MFQLIRTILRTCFISRISRSRKSIIFVVLIDDQLEPVNDELRVKMFSIGLILGTKLNSFKLISKMSVIETGLANCIKREMERDGQYLPWESKLEPFLKMYNLALAS